MKFSAPVVRVALTTDRCLGEKRDLVRLSALKFTSARQPFTILAITEAFDNATTKPDNRLEVQSTTPFLFALFQCTTEREGFDDLEIEWAPEAAAVPAKPEK